MSQRGHDEPAVSRGWRRVYSDYNQSGYTIRSQLLYVRRMQDRENKLKHRLRKERLTRCPVLSLYSVSIQPQLR